jgi:hypothetical protein
MRRAIRLFLPVILFAMFLLSGLIGLLCEQIHNDLFVSTGAFVTSFTTMIGVAYKIYCTLIP